MNIKGDNTEMNFLLRWKKHKEIKKICIEIMIHTIIFIVLFTIQNLIYLSNAKNQVVNSLKKNIVNSQNEIIGMLKGYENELKNLSFRMLDDSAILLFATREANEKDEYINVNKSVLSYLKYSKSDAACIYNVYTERGYVFSEKQSNVFDNEVVKQMVENYNNGKQYYVIDYNRNPIVTYITKDYRGIYVIYQINDYYLSELKKISKESDVYVYSYDNCLLKSNNNNYSISEIKMKVNGSQEFYYKRNFVLATHTQDFDIITVVDRNHISAEVNSGMQQFMTLFYIMFGCLLFVSVVGFIITSKSFESTVLRLMSGGTGLEREKLILKDLFDKKVIDVSDRAKLDEKYCKKSYFRCMYLNFDEKNIYHDSSASDECLDYILTNAHNKNELGSGVDLHVTIINKYSIGLFVSSDMPVDNKTIVKFINNMHHIGPDNNIVFTCIIGKEFDDTHNIPEQILQTVSYLRYEFMTGLNSTIFVGEMDYLSKDAEYPIETEKEIVQAINNGDYEMYYNSIEKFMINANNLEPILFKEWLLKLVFSMAKNVYCINKKDISFEIIDKLSKSRTIDEAINIFETLIPFEGITVSTDVENNDFANMIKRNVEHNYSNVDFNLSYLSDLVGMSPAYLGKLIKNTLNMTFSSYLTNYRVNKAKELLATDMKIDDVSRVCGFGSTSYFIKLFKKTFGVTPKVYREKNLDAENADTY